MLRLAACTRDEPWLSDKAIEPLSAARQSVVMTKTISALTVSKLSDDYGGCAVQALPLPTPAPGEARVRVKAAAVNFPDLLMTQGKYQLKPDLPFTPGSEFSGVVEAVGDGVDPALIGSEVVGGARFGAMADAICVAADTLRPKPERLSWAAAASYRATYLTAWVSLVRRAQLQAGEWVLVHGAAGGVGLACVDLAKHLGAKVIATSASAEKRAEITRLFAPDAVIDSAPGFRDQVKALTGGRGADVICDPVGGDQFDESTRCIAFDGRLLVLGFTSGRIPSVSVNMPLIKGFSVVGVRAGEYGRQFPARGVENLAAIDALIADGTLTPHVHGEYALGDWRSAFDQLGQRKVVGKAVIVME
jgi:NADPH:quinone reductase